MAGNCHETGPQKIVFFERRFQGAFAQALKGMHVTSHSKGRSFLQGSCCPVLGNRKSKSSSRAQGWKPCREKTKVQVVGLPAKPRAVRVTPPLQMALEAPRTPESEPGYRPRPHPPDCCWSRGHSAGPGRSEVPGGGVVGLSPWQLEIQEDDYSTCILFE